MELNNLKDKLTEYFSSLSEREKRVVVLGIPLVLLFLYVVAVLFPLAGLKEKYVERKVIVEKKFRKLEPQLKELLCLRKKLDPLETRLKKGTNLDVPSFVQTVARMVGLKINDVKVMPGEEKNGYSREVVSVTFKEAEIDRVVQFISNLEKSSYYFRADGVSISDYDENGLVSGKVTLLFYRRSSEG